MGDWVPIPALGDHLNHLEATLTALYVELGEMLTSGDYGDCQDVFDEVVAVSNRASAEMNRLFPWHTDFRIKETWW